MRTGRHDRGLARLLLVLAGTGVMVYGGWLLRPQLAAAVPWLLAGPLLHDLLLAPLVALAGLALGRLLPDPARRFPVIAGLVATGTLLLIALPLLWRPAAAPPNPGLQDRDYLRGLLSWLAVGWLAIGVWTLRRRPKP